MRRLLVLALLATLPTVALAKKEAWSEIDGTGATATQADHADVAVVELDGKKFQACATRPVRGDAGSGTGSLFGDGGGKRAPKGACVTATRGMKIAPGAHASVVATTRLPAGGGFLTQPFAFDAAPCTRYHLVAHHDGPGANRFEVMVAGQEAIAGCTAPELAATTAPAAPAQDASMAPGAPVAPTVEGAGSPAR